MMRLKGDNNSSAEAGFLPNQRITLPIKNLELDSENECLSLNSAAVTTGWQAVVELRKGTDEPPAGCEVTSFLATTPWYIVHAPFSIWLFAFRTKQLPTSITRIVSLDSHTTFLQSCNELVLSLLPSTPTMQQHWLGAKAQFCQASLSNARSSPHISPKNPSPSVFEATGLPIPSANSYLLTWEAHPILPGSPKRPN